jgi:hypothetical protein
MISVVVGFVDSVISIFAMRGDDCPMHIQWFGDAIKQIINMQGRQLSNKQLLNDPLCLDRRGTTCHSAMLLPCGSMVGLIPWDQLSLVLSDFSQVAKEIHDRDIVSMHGGGRGSMCDIYFSLCNLVGDKIGRAGWGHWIGHGDDFVFFFEGTLFLGERDGSRREK